MFDVRYTKAEDKAFNVKPNHCHVTVSVPMLIDPFTVIAAILDCVATTVFRHFTFLSIKLQKINVLTQKFVPGHSFGRETRFST